jgi:hypothetical protein
VATAVQEKILGALGQAPLQLVQVVTTQAVAVALVVKLMVQVAQAAVVTRMVLVLELLEP